MQRQFDVIIERDSEGYYIASVPQLRSEGVSLTPHFPFPFPGAPSVGGSGSVFAARRADRHRPSGQA
jgi:hypothetical protein